MISILMPVKNAEPYLQECIDSILSQTSIDWELIAVNDHSSDNSLKILKTAALQDKRIQIFNNEGHGIITALQLAYAKSKGDFITRMDADDINSSEKLALMRKQLLESGKGFLATGLVQYFAEGGVGDGFKKYERWLNALNKNGNAFQEIYKECPIPSPCWMVNRTDFDACGAFDSDIYPEDYDLCFRFYKHGLKPIPTQEVLLHWRDHATRTSRTDKNYIEDKLLAIKCYYFIDIDLDKKQELILWGAGRRGKFIANYLLAQDIDFTWVCNNDKKIGKDIYGMELQDAAKLTKGQSQVIISVANDLEQKEIVASCKGIEMKYYSFC